MKKFNKKTLILTLSIVALVALTVVGTIAYFTSGDSVTNTFTVGKVKISMVETKVDKAGVPVDPAETTKANVYSLVPAHNYVKDPVLTVEADSENSYLFIKVQNDISAVEVAGNTTGKTIAEQIVANGWTALPDNDGVYYQLYTTSDKDTSLPIFSEFKIDPEADETSLADFAKEDSTKAVAVTAYAIQQEGFSGETALADAWAKVSKQDN